MALVAKKAMGCVIVADKYREVTERETKMQAMVRKARENATRKNANKRENNTSTNPKTHNVAPPFPP